MVFQVAVLRSSIGGRRRVDCGCRTQRGTTWHLHRRTVMITQVACLLCAAALSYADDAAAKKALAELQGNWKLTEFGVGEEQGVLPQQPRWVVKGNKVFYAGEELAVLTLDPAGTPKVIDLALA